MGENNKCRQYYLYHCRCFSKREHGSINKVHGRVACSAHIGSMKECNWGWTIKKVYEPGSSYQTSHYENIDMVKCNGSRVFKRLVKLPV